MTAEALLACLALVGGVVGGCATVPPPHEAEMVRQAGAAYEDEHRDPARMARWDAERSQIAYADLNGDGLNELLIFVADRDRCGTGGCDLLVLTHRTGGWVPVATTTVSRLPVYRLDSDSNGWADLGVTVGGGSGPSGVARLRFDGTRYPSNPTMEPLIPSVAGQRVLLADGLRRAER